MPGRRPWIGWIVPAIALAGFGVLLSRLSGVADGHGEAWARAWVPTLGVDLAFRLDGLSLTFALLVTGTGFFVALYALSYLRGNPHQGRFFWFFLLFMASMVGLVLADDLILLFVFWELTTVSSFLLIGFDHENAAARRSARQALLVTGAGGLALLAGLVLLGQVAGTLRLGEVVALGAEIRGSALYPAILTLVLLGAFTKSAIFPFHFWLPNAMAAPTPVSAYLHSATMVKGGIYLLARLHPALGGTLPWIWILTVAGALTAVWGAVVSLRQTDLKVALAWTTVMALGTLVLFLGSEAEAGLVAAVTFLLVHALYKSTLFLVVGNIDHAAGTREVDQLGGLARAMPFTAVAAAVAAFSMAGFPPFLGFLGKELKYEGALAVSSEPWLAATASVAANALMVTLAGIVAFRPFFRRGGPSPKVPHEADAFMLAGPIVLAALGLLFGLLPGFVSHAVVQPAVSAITGREIVLKLKLWHGINVPLMLSVLTVALGLVIYRWHAQARRTLARILDHLPLTGDRVYEGALHALARTAEVQTRWLQPGRLRFYLQVIFGTLVAIVGGVWLVRGVSLPAVEFPRLGLPTWGVTLLVAAGTVTVLLARSRLVAVCALSLIGAGLALIFVIYGQPDVAITQLMVDILVVAILVLILPRLPRFTGAAHGGRGGTARDALLAAGVGLLMAALVFAVGSTHFDHSLTEYYEAKSVSEAYGRNIVNVILVDFRALDTLGEIVVLALAGLAAWGLLTRKRGTP